MIITRTPLRISIGGGGTDLPSFYKRFGSQFVSASIDKYIYVIIHERKYYDKFLLRYSKTEEVKKVDSIKNNIIRECLKLLNITNPLEITAISDVGGESGLGSSGAFTVGLLNALHTYKEESLTQEELAEEACHVSIDILEEPSGKQDEYITAVGGLTNFKINKQGDVYVSKDEYDTSFIMELEKYLYMFFTGIHRKSKTILSHQQEATEKNDDEVIKNLFQVQSLGIKISEALKEHDALRFGELLHEHWLLKRQRAKTTNTQIDKWYAEARLKGAIGGKIMGAGGGGFFLFFSEKDLSINGLTKVSFKIDFEGTKVILK